MFQSLLELLAARVGNLLNLSELAKEIDLSQPTIKRRVSLLENSRIIFLLRPFPRNIGKRVIRSPKVYFYDTGSASYLLRCPDSETLYRGPMNWAFLENFVIAELLKKRMYKDLGHELYFYRDSNKNEIDMNE